MGNKFIKIVVLLLSFFIIVNYFGMIRVRSAGPVALTTGALTALEAKAILTILGNLGLVGLTAGAAILIYNLFIKEWLYEKMNPVDVINQDGDIVISNEMLDFIENDFKYYIDRNISDIKSSNITYYDLVCNETRSCSNEYGPYGSELYDQIGPLTFDPFTGTCYTSFSVLVTVKNVRDTFGNFIDTSGLSVIVADYGYGTFVDGVCQVETGVIADGVESFDDLTLYNERGDVISHDADFVYIDGLDQAVTVDITVQASPYVDVSGIVRDIQVASGSFALSAGVYSMPIEDEISSYVVSVPDLVPVSSGIDLSGVIGLLQSILDFLRDVLGMILDGIKAIPRGITNIYDWLSDTLASAIEGIKTGVLAIPQGITNIYDWLSDTLASAIEGIKTGVYAIPNAIKGISDWLSALFLPGTATLDFSPFKEINIKEKFPFCLPFDIKNSIENLRSAPEIPRWKVPIKNVDIDLNFGVFEEFSVISRYFFTLIYTMILIILTRKIIGG